MCGIWARYMCGWVPETHICSVRACREPVGMVGWYDWFMRLRKCIFVYVVQYTCTFVCVAVWVDASRMVVTGDMLSAT